MKKNLLKLLLDKNIISTELYKEVVEKSLLTNFSEEQIILRDIKVDINVIISIVENDLKIPYIDFESMCTKNVVFNLISKEIASRYSLIAFNDKNNELHVAFSNPFDIKVIDELKFITNKKIKIFFAVNNDITMAIEN